MFRKIAVSLFALLICQTIIAAEKVTFEMNQVTIEAKENGVEISWFCQEPNMEYVKKFYSKPRWNVFTGEALEIHFTPYSSSAAGRIAFPYYRMLVNPSGRSLTAFLTPDWSSAGVYPEIEKLDKDGWYAKWFINYAALESSFYNVANGKPLSLRNKWRFDFKYRRSAGGKNEILSAKPFVLTIPEAMIVPFRQLVLNGVKAVPGQSGKVALDAVLKNTVNASFTGKAQWLLYSDGKAEVVKELPVSLTASGKMDCRAEITLPERAVKFAVALKVVDASGKVMRISRKLAVKNPYVE